MARRTSMSDTVARYLRMLELVPRGRRVDAAFIERQLSAEGIEVTRRTVQRDLELLAMSFPGLTCDRRSKPYGWSWDKNAPLHELPAMGVQSAMTLEMMRSHLTQVLPRSTVTALQPYFDRARATLKDSSAAPMVRWLRKVHVVPRGQPLRPPQVPPPVLDVVYAALLECRRFWVRYRRRGATRDKEYDVNPLGLVVRNGALVLVCTMRDYDEVVQIVLHRVRAARLLDTRSRTPIGFDLRAHVEAGGVAFPLGKPIRLRMLMRKDAALTLHESHLSADQRITSHDDERDRVEATVADTLELRGWLASYGGLIEVLAPASLRKQMTQIAREMLARYEPASATARRRPAASMEVVGAIDGDQSSDEHREQPKREGAGLRGPHAEGRPR